MKKWMIAAGILTVMGALAACTPTKTLPSNVPVVSETESGDGERPTEAPVEPMDMAFVFRVKDGEFQRVTMDVDKMTEQFLMEKLIEYGVLDEGTEILSFEIEGDMGAGPGSDTPAGPGYSGDAGGEPQTPPERIGTLDLSQVPEWSADQEAVMLKCLGDTFVDNFQLSRLKLLVNGENYSGAGITVGDDDYLEYESGYKNVVE